MTISGLRRRASSVLALWCLLSAACSGSSSSGGDSDAADGGQDAGDAGDLGASDGGDGAADTDAGPTFGVVTCQSDVDTSSTLSLAGTLACSACGTAVTLWLYDNAFLDGEPLCAVTVPLEATFQVDVPVELGETWLFGFGDDEGPGALDPGEPFGSADPSPLALGSDDVADVALVLLTPQPATDEMGGAIDEHGDAVTPDRLLARFAPGTSESDARAAVEAHGAALDVWLDAIDTAIVSFEVPAETADAAILDPLRQVETALGGEAAVEAVFRDYRWVTTDTRGQTEDYLSLTPAQQSAYDIIGQDEAKRIFDECSYHLAPAERQVSVVVAVVDNDLLGAQAATELSGLVVSLADHHKHIDREFCGLTEGGFQRLCEPLTNVGHGAAVSSVIAARNDGSGMNGVLSGFAGTTPGGDDYQIAYTLRLFNTGHGLGLTSAELLDAMQAAAESDAQVINMSLGVAAPASHNIRGYLNTYRSFADLIRGYPGQIWVMSAGNAGQNLANTPSWAALAASNLVTVGATDAADARSVWSATSSSSFAANIVDLAAPGTAVYVANVPVSHSGTTLHPDVTTSVVSAQGYFSVDGTSLSAPLVTGAMAYLRAFDATLDPAEAVRRARATADPGPASLGGRRLNLARLVTAGRAGDINTSVTHLLSFIGVIESSTGGCALTPMVGMECIPLVRSGNALSVPAAVVDDAGNTYVLSGTTDGASFEITITGLGITAGVGPAVGTYSGTLAADPDNPANLILTGGAFTGQTRTADGAPADCDYGGTFDAVLRGVRRP